MPQLSRKLASAVSWKISQDETVVLENLSDCRIVNLIGVMEGAVVLYIFVEDISEDLCQSALLLMLIMESACETLNDSYSFTSNCCSHDTLVSE